MPQKFPGEKLAMKRYRYACIMREPLFRCRICLRSVSLDDSKTDEQGIAVHEDCYVREMIVRFQRGRHGHILDRRNIMSPSDCANGTDVAASDVRFEGEFLPRAGLVDPSI
jgi:hypothetical protein